MLPALPFLGGPNPEDMMLREHGKEAEEMRTSSSLMFLVHRNLS